MYLYRYSQEGENDLAYDDIYDLISDFDPETNNFVESIYTES